MSRPYTGVMKTHRQDPFLTRQSLDINKNPVAIKMRKKLRTQGVQRPDMVEERKRENVMKEFSMGSTNLVKRHKNVINAQNLMTRLPDYFVKEIKQAPIRLEPNKGIGNKKTEDIMSKIVKRKSMEGRRNGKRKIVVFKEKPEIIGNDSLDLSDIREVNKPDNEMFEIKADLMELLNE